MIQNKQKHDRASAYFVSFFYVKKMLYVEKMC